MNKTIVAAALAINVAWFGAFAVALAHAGPELKVTPYEAGLDSASGDGGTVLAAPRARFAARWSKTPAAETVKPTTKFVIAAIIRVEGTPVWVGMYRGVDPFDDEAACEAYMNSDDYKESRDGLEAVAKQRFHPDAKVGVSCKELPAE